jgi:hypothetical protein
MNRSKVGKWARRAVWGTLLGVAALGCSPLNVISFMFAHDEKVTAAYPLTFGKDSPKKHKDEVVVLVLPHLAPGTSPTFFSAERDLAAELARTLPERAKENKDKKKVRVIGPAQVDRFKSTNTNWKALNPGDIGQKLGADFVLDIELSKMRLYQPNAGGERIYEGRADVQVTIYEVGVEGGVRDYPITFSYPKGTPLGRDGSSMSESEFRKEYILNLAGEITEHHVDHKAPNGLDGLGR